MVIEILRECVVSPQQYGLHIFLGRGGGGVKSEKLLKGMDIFQFETGMGGRAEGSSSLLCRDSFIKKGAKSQKWEEKWKLSQRGSHSLQSLICPCSIAKRALWSRGEQ